MSLSSGSKARENRAGWRQIERASVRTVAGKDGARSRDENFHVEPQRPSPAIAEVQAHHFIESRSAPAAHLPQSGNTRLDVQYSTAMPDVINFKLVGNRRPRADKGHFAAQNVPKLWKFIQAGFPEESADGSHSRVVHDLVYWLLGSRIIPAFFLTGNKLLDVFLMNLRIVIRKHGAEFQTLKAVAKLTQTFLFENHRTF